MVSPEMALLSVFITPWMNPTESHCATRRAWPVDHRLEKPGGPLDMRIVARDGVVAERAQPVEIAARGEILERADADMARRHAGQDRTGERPRLAQDPLAGLDGGERAGGRDPERMHRLGDHVFAQHRAEPRPPVAHPAVGGRSRALELDVAPPARAVHHLAQQERAPVAQLRREAAELMAGIDLRQRRRAVGRLVAGKDLRARVGVDAFADAESSARPAFHATSRGARTGTALWRV